MLGVPLLLLVLAAIVDCRRREIPDTLSVVLLVWAIGTTTLGVSSHGWMSLVLGLGLGLMLGLLLFWVGAFGGGDAKVLAALGATLGPRDFVVLLFYVAIAGGLLAAVAVARGKRDIAYAPAMALGFVAFMIGRATW